MTIEAPFLWINKVSTFCSCITHISSIIDINRFALLTFIITGTCFIQKYMPPPLPYFKVNICSFPLPHFASICFAYLWSFRRPNYIVTLPRYFSFRLPHLNIPTRAPLRRIGQEYSADVAWSTFKSLKRIHFRFALDFSYAFGIL